VHRCASGDKKVAAGTEWDSCDYHTGNAIFIARVTDRKRTSKEELAACERELRESDSAEATDRLEARIAATLANTGKQVQSLFTLAHAQCPHQFPVAVRSDLRG
jgi:hypothetical protein